MKNIITGLLLLTATMACAQTYTEKITREFAFEKKSADNALIIANINGHVTVTGYAGDKVLVEVTRTIWGKTADRLERGKADLQLGIKDLADTLIFYVDIAGTCNQFGRDPKHNSRRGGWGYLWQEGRRCEGCQTTYDYSLDFVVKVPESLHVLASTINKGNITIRGVKGAVVAENINGSVSMSDLAREAELTTINGDVTIDVQQNPAKACRFYTLNGDINANFRKGLAAELSFESFNGEFYTDLDAIQPLPATLEKAADGMAIVTGRTLPDARVGAGGPLLDFETFNGNVYLRTN